MPGDVGGREREGASGKHQAIARNMCEYVRMCFLAPLVSGLLTRRSQAASMPGTQHGNNDLFHSKHMLMNKHTYIETYILSVFSLRFMLLPLCAKGAQRL